MCIFVFDDKKSAKIFGVENIYFVHMICYT